jgi:hypothetical protein
MRKMHPKPGPKSWILPAGPARHPPSVKQIVVPGASAFKR